MLTRDRSITPVIDPGIDLQVQLADGAGTDPRAPQSLGDVLDPPRRDASQVHLHESLLDARLPPPVPLDDLRLERERPQSGNFERHLAGGDVQGPAVRPRPSVKSLSRPLEPLAAAVREHWGIENRMRWVLDVVFREDRNRARAENAQANLGILRRTALLLLKNTEGMKGSVHCRRQQAAWNELTLEKSLFGCQRRED